MTANYLSEPSGTRKGFAKKESLNMPLSPNRLKSCPQKYFEFLTSTNFAI